MLFCIAMNTYVQTTVTFQRRAILRRTDNAELLLNTIFRYRDQGRYSLHGFAIMPEHLHILLTPAQDQSIERCAQCIKGGFSHALRSQFAGEVWQPGFFEHRVRDALDFSKQLEYIAHNPVRRGLPDYPFVHTRFPERIDPGPVLLRGI